MFLCRNMENISNYLLLPVLSGALNKLMVITKGCVQCNLAYGLKSFRLQNQNQNCLLVIHPIAIIHQDP